MENRKPTRDNTVREWWRNNVRPLGDRAELEVEQAMRAAVRRALQRGTLNDSGAAKDRVMEAVRVLRDFRDKEVELVRRFRNASPESPTSECVSELTRCALHSFDAVKTTLQRKSDAISWGERGRGLQNTPMLSAANGMLLREAAVMRRELAAAVELEATTKSAPAEAVVEVRLPEGSGWRFWLPHGLAAAGVVLAVLTLVL
jgi:hypothetical protein